MSNVQLAVEKLNALKTVDPDDPQVVAACVKSIVPLFQEVDIPNYSVILPLLLNLKGRPFHLRDHFPLEPMYKRVGVPNNIILRCGRQVSKCLHKDTPVLMADGNYRKISELSAGDSILSVSDSNELSTNKISNIFSPTKKRVHRITTFSGYSVKLSYEHRLKTDQGFLSLRDLEDCDDNQLPNLWVLNHDTDQLELDWIANIEFDVEEAQELYDIEVENDHTFIAAGIVSHNSTTLAAQSVIRGCTTPYLNIINVAPLFEQIRKFSNNYVRPFIEESPIRNILLGEGVKDNSVFQRTFANAANLFFTFASADAERLRGISGDILNLDEIQDMDIDHLPVMQSCLDASDLAMIQMSGTPKTTDNTIDYFWERSSQAHWATKCSCGKWNIACLEHGLDDMVQEHGFACKYCMKRLNPREGQFIHAYPERANKFLGLHIPQPIMPMHYDNPAKWANLYEKKLIWPQYRYWNETLGESCDVGSRLISRTQLQAISKLPWDNTVESAAAGADLGDYGTITMGIDWGVGAGGTIKRKGGQIVVEGGTTSFTVITICGFTKANPYKPNVIVAVRLPPSMSPQDEVKYIIQLFKRFKCNLMAHDFGGAGFLRETLLIQAGLQPNRLMPCQYVHSIHTPIVYYFDPKQSTATRQYYAVSKSRSLGIICAMIQQEAVTLPQWTTERNEDGIEVCIYEDFLALIEESRENFRGADTYMITRDPKKPDDFCHSLNFACAAQWHTKQIYPQIAKDAGIEWGDPTRIAEETNQTW